MRTGGPSSRAARKITDLLVAFADWLYPPQCLICGERSELTPFLCERCFASCPRCGQIPDPLIACGNPPADKAFSMFYFNEGVQALVYHLKYGDMPFIGAFLGRQAGRYFASTSLSGCDALVPVPLYRTRLRERTYNQSDYIASGIGKVWGVPVEKKLLVRCRDTGTQTELSRIARRENVRNAFRVGRGSRLPSHACIVDDVLTTGATCMEAARSLKNAGVEKVSILTLAAAEKDQ